MLRLLATGAALKLPSVATLQRQRQAGLKTGWVLASSGCVGLEATTGGTLERARRDLPKHQFQFRGWR